MKQEIYNYYTNALSSQRLVFKYMKPWWTCYMMVAFITATFSVYFFCSNNTKMVFGIMLIFGLVTGIINEKAKRVLLKNYNIKPSQKMWANEEYMKMRQELLTKYLESKGLYTEKKLKELVEICYKESERSKYKGYVNWGLFLAVVIPIWTQFLASIFKISNNMSDSVNILGSIFIGTVIIFIVGFLTKFVAQDILDNTFNKKSNAYKKLAYVLEDILFLIDIE